MDEHFPTHVSITSKDGPRVSPVAAWLEKSDTEKIQELSRNHVVFLKDGRPLPIREALIAMKMS